MPPTSTAQCYFPLTYYISGVANVISKYFNNLFLAIDYDYVIVRGRRLRRPIGRPAAGLNCRGEAVSGRASNVFFDLAVPDVDHAVGIGRNVGLVGHQDDRVAAFMKTPE